MTLQARKELRESIKTLQEAILRLNEQVLPLLDRRLQGNIDAVIQTVSRVSISTTEALRSVGTRLSEMEHRHSEFLKTQWQENEETRRRIDNLPAEMEERREKIALLEKAIAEKAKLLDEREQAIADMENSSVWHLWGTEIVILRRRRR